MAYERKEWVGNAAQTTLTAGINDTVTSLSIADATNWPTGAVGPFVITVGIGTASEEKMLCTARVGTTLTVRTSTGRGHDETTAQAHSIGTTVDHTLDAETFDQLSRLANLMTVKGDLLAFNGTNPVRVGTGAVSAASDAEVLQLDWSEPTGLTFGALVTLLSQASAPLVAGAVRLWYDETLKTLRPSDGSSWLLSTTFLSVNDEAARDALFSSPEAGNAVWREDVEICEVHDGTNWVTIGVPRFADTTARNAYFTTPTDGDEAYITGTHGKYLYREDEWILTSRNIVVSDTAPAGPLEGDIWLQPIE